MSKLNRRKRQPSSETGALQILEEAFHLMRTLEVRHFWTYYSGAVPFALGLLYFAADMSRSSLAERDAAFAALVMVALYFWMRFCQAKFCEGLWAKLDPGNDRRMSKAEQFSSLAALWFLHAFQVPLLVVGFFFVVPLGWILAAQQNFSALALTQDHKGRPLRSILGRSVSHSHDQWAQNHGLLIILFFVSAFTWVNIIATCILVPGFGKSIFGIETIFSLSPAAAVMNTTFLLGSFLLLQMVITPLMHAVYVLRCFYAESRLTGADLLSRLAVCREKLEQDQFKERGGYTRSVLILILVSGWSVDDAFSRDVNEGNPGRDAIRAEQFRGEIAETLAEKQYQWQFSRRVVDSAEEEEESWIGQRLGEIAESAREILSALEDWFEKTLRRMMEGGRSERDFDAEEGLKFFKELSSTASLILVGLILGVLFWLAASLYRKYRKDEKSPDQDQGGTGVIDLSSEDTVASQLHEEEWLRLAREQIERGEERLAVRALFLATLAHLGERGLLKIARFKSNRDYRVELGLRARSLATLRLAFDENTTLFERVWYGMHSLGEGSVDFYLRNHETIARESGKAVRAAFPVSEVR